MSKFRYKLLLPILTSILLAACGGGGGGGGGGGSNSTNTTPTLPSSTSLARQCAVPRPAGSTDIYGNPYNDKQGSLSTEMAWIHSWVNETYLWYADVGAFPGDANYANPGTYYIGATVPYLDPATNINTPETLQTNYDVVDAYFNSQRSIALTANGTPKDRFHFTYTTTDWEADQTGQAVGFGFYLDLIAAAPPRQAIIEYSDPGTPAAQNQIVRGSQIVSVNGVDFVNASDTASLATLNEGLFNPTAGTQYTFGILDPGGSTTRFVTMTAQSTTITPVQNVGTLPAPNSSVGYIEFDTHIPPAEAQLVAAVNTLNSANNGQGISDLVLDLRYNGGGALAIASELAYMIAGQSATSGKIFENETTNNKNLLGPNNPYGYALENLPFLSTTSYANATSPLPQLGLKRLFVITGSGTCSASEAIMNGLQGIGVQVIQIGDTTCGKPYAFFATENCSTTYFTIQIEGTNNVGFGDYGGGFTPGGNGTPANNPPGCVVPDDFSKQMGDPAEARLAAALQYRTTGTCPTVSSSQKRALAHARAMRLIGSSHALRPPFYRTNSILPGNTKPK